MYEQEERQSHDKLEIYTLGQFLVKRGDKVLTEDAGRSYKVWRLFKYLLSCRGKTTEELMESLYPEEEPKDPERTLRNLVYRLRRLLTAGLPPESAPRYIILSQGLYYFNFSANCWLDTEEFKKLCSEAGKNASGDPAKAIGLYHKALSLYNGYYLTESLYDDWVVPVRNYYHRLYLESVYKLIELLKKAGSNLELKNVCEKVFLIEPFQEDLHMCFMEALLEEGRADLAKAHYNYASSLLYRETGLKPSEAMRNLYKKITSEKKPREEDGNHLLRGLNERSIGEGAFFCDPETFMLLYRLEEVRTERNKQAVFWGCLALFYPDNILPDEQKRDKAMEFLREILRKNLRKGDVVCRWNSNQFYLLLSCLTQEQAAKALERIKNCFFEFQTCKNIIMRSISRRIQDCGEVFPQLRTFA